MANIIVVGAQWGDEAKGKIVDYLAQRGRMVVRYSGGNNAGHSVIVGDDEFEFHLVPAGILHPELLCVIADGVVADPAILVKELQALSSRGVSLANLKISAASHVILPYHRLQDELEEESRGDEKIGTTGRGIGPAYADKAARHGIRMAEFIDEERFAARLNSVLTSKNAVFTKVYDREPLSAEAIFKEYREYAQFLAPFVTDTPGIIYEAAANGHGVIFEGAQGTLLDIDLGTYPYVTSSHPIAGGALLGTGIGPTLIDGVIGVAKSYTTRVGAGAFPTELNDEIGAAIREKGHEYGTTTGRARRCGWLDAVILRYACRVNGLSALALGHLDVLSGFNEVKICVAYETGDGQRLDNMPSNLASRNDLTPVYETLPGWTEEIDHVNIWGNLPENARRFVERVQELVGVPIVTLSLGPARHQTIILNEKVLQTGRS